jgi:hypothetical protein
MPISKDTNANDNQTNCVPEQTNQLADADFGRLYGDCRPRRARAGAAENAIGCATN